MFPYNHTRSEAMMRDYQVEVKSRQPLVELFTTVVCHECRQITSLFFYCSIHLTKQILFAHWVLHIQISKPDIPKMTFCPHAEVRLASKGEGPRVSLSIFMPILRTLQRKTKFSSNFQMAIYTCNLLYMQGIFHT